MVSEKSDNSHPMHAKLVLIYDDSLFDDDTEPDFDLEKHLESRLQEAVTRKLTRLGVEQPKERSLSVTDNIDRLFIEIDSFSPDDLANKVKEMRPNLPLF